MANFVSDKRNVEIEVPYDFAIIRFRFHRLVFVNVGSKKVLGVVVHARVLAVREIIT